MLNTREVLFLKTAANLKLLDQDQLAQAQEGIKQARAQNNPIFVWDLLVHWKFLPKEKAEYVVKLILQAEKKQAGAAPSGAVPVAQPPAQAAGAAPAVPAAQLQVPSATPAVPLAQPLMPGDASAVPTSQPQDSAAAPAPVEGVVAADAVMAAQGTKRSAPIGLIAAGLVLVFAVGGGAALYFLKPAESPTGPGEVQEVAKGNVDTTVEDTSGGGIAAANPGESTGGPPAISPGGPPAVSPGGPPAISPGGPPVGLPAVNSDGPPTGNPDEAPLEPGGPPGPISEALANKASAEYQTLSAQVAELITNKDYDQAILKLNAFKLNTTDPVLRAKLDAQIAEATQKKTAPPSKSEVDEPVLSLPGASRVSASGQITKEIDAYTNIRQQLDPLLEARKFSEAKGILSKLVENPENEIFFNFLNQLQGDLKRAEEFAGKSLGILKKSIGEEIQWGGLPSKIISVDEENLVVEAIGREKIVPLNQIKVMEHMKVQDINSRDANTDQLFAMGLLYFCDGQYSQAQKLLDETKLTHNSESYLDFMNKDNDSKALGIVRKIQEAKEAKDVKELFSLTKELRESHEQSPVTSAYNDLLIQADEEVQKYKDERDKQIAALEALVDKAEEKAREELSKENSENMKKIADMEKTPQMDKFSYKLIKPTQGPEIIKINNADKPLKEIDQDEAAAKSKNENLKELEKFLDDHEKKTSLLISKSKSHAEKEVRRLSSEIGGFERVMTSHKARAAQLFSKQKSRLETQVKKLKSRIKGGDTMTEEEMMDYLTR